jgi:hypothetical protein
VSISTLLVAIVVVSAVVALLAFTSGDRARRTAHGRAGPRPAPSIGEAVRLANQRPGGRALVVFVGDDAASMEAARALAEDGDVLAALERPSLVHTVVRTGGEERQVAALLVEKYAKRTLPAEGPAVLLLDARGRLIAHAEPKSLPLWLPGWVDGQPETAPGP